MTHFEAPTQAPPEPAVLAKRTERWLILGAIGLFIIGLLLISTLFVQSIAEKQITKILNKNLGSLPPGVQLTYQRVRVNVWRQRVHLLGVDVRKADQLDGFFIERVSVGGLDWSTLFTLISTRKPVLPRHIEVTLEGVHVPTWALGSRGPETLNALGSKELIISTSVELELSPESKSFAVEYALIELPAAGRLEFAFELAQVRWPTKSEMAEFKKNPRVFIENAGEFKSVALRSLLVKYEDHSLVRRAIGAFVASGEDHPVALLNLAIETASDKRRVASGAAPRFTIDALTKLRDFLTKPGAIQMDVRPAKPVPLFSLIDETEESVDVLAKRLGIDIAVMSIRN